MESNVDEPKSLTEETKRARDDRTSPGHKLAFIARSTDPKRLPWLRSIMAHPEKFSRTGAKLFHQLNRALGSPGDSAGIGALRDKLIFNGFVRATGFRSTEVVAVVTPLTAALVGTGERYPLAAGLMRLQGKHFVKGRYGSKGAGAFRLEIGEARFRINGDECGPQALVARIAALGPGGAVVEREVVQHPELSKIYAGSVNTVRVLTSCLRSPAHVVCATLRMGRAGSVVDNASAGGIYAGIDRETGQLRGKAHAMSGETFSQHPNSGEPFKDRIVPAFREIEATCCRLHDLFGPLPTIGWDVTVTREGPLVIEANDAWTPTLHKPFDRRFLDELAEELIESNLLTRFGLRNEAKAARRRGRSR